MRGGRGLGEQTEGLRGRSRQILCNKQIEMGRRKVVGDWHEQEHYIVLIIDKAG